MLTVSGICVIAVTLLGLFGGINLPTNIDEFAKSIEGTRKGYWELFTKAVTIFVVVGALWKYWEDKRVLNEKALKNEFDSVKLKININYVNYIIPIIDTTVLNDVSIDKGIFHSFLLITKKDDDTHFMRQANQNLETNFKCTNDLIGTSPFIKRLAQGFAYIPLPFFYSENLKVGNEILQFSYSLSINELAIIKPNQNTTEHYEVRFFIFRDDGGYHRSTESALILFPNN